MIQIANMVIRQGETEPFLRNIFTFDTCAPIVGCQVLSFEKETLMLEVHRLICRASLCKFRKSRLFVNNCFFFILKKWAEFVRQLDPDIFTGYNINNFDFPYLINRAEHLNVKNFSFLGRIKNIKSVIKDHVLQSKQLGRRENKSINFEGRVPFDLLLVREYITDQYIHIFYIATLMKIYVL